MSKYVVSYKYSEFIKELNNNGYQTIPTDKIEIFPIPEQYHADMQILIINDTIFMLNECSNLKREFDTKNIIYCSNKVGERYPKNILLNFLYLNNTIYGKLSDIEPALKEYCLRNNIKMINLNQGYCRCSTLVVNDNAVITADTSIEKAMKENRVDVLKITEGHIILDGFEYGFIGGASGKINDNTIIFFGNIKNHPDYNLIYHFCNKHNVNINIISKNTPLTDIGGIVKVE